MVVITILRVLYVCCSGLQTRGQSLKPNPKPKPRFRKGPKFGRDGSDIVNSYTGVRCNCVRHAILSAPDTFKYAIVSGAMQKLSGGHLHDYTCMCARKRACMHRNYVLLAAWIFTYLMIAANTQLPNNYYVIHDMHLARKTNCEHVLSTKGV